MDYQTKKTDELRKRKVLSTFGFIVANGEKGSFIWTGKWFKFVTIKERKEKVRYTYFNEWDYRDHWGDWKDRWVFVKIIK
jgi:hypothetical protein